MLYVDRQRTFDLYVEYRGTIHRASRPSRDPPMKIFGMPSLDLLGKQYDIGTCRRTLSLDTPSWYDIPIIIIITLFIMLECWYTILHPPGFVRPAGPNAELCQVCGPGPD